MLFDIGRFRNIPLVSGIILTMMLLVSSPVCGQLSVSGRPVLPDLGRLQQERLIQELAPPDVEALEKEDMEAGLSGLPERMGISIPVNLTTSNSGIKILSEGSVSTWVLVVRSSGAYGLGLYFSDFKLPAGAQLFVYPEDKSRVLGAFTSRNNQPSGKFAVEITKGEALVIEYTCPVQYSGYQAFVIDEVLYAYKPLVFPGDDFRSAALSGSCEVNAACTEGDDWRDQIKSVVRIQIKRAGSSYWCTGTLVNNTASDFAPLILTADHCAGTFPGPYSSPDDVSRWIFYFNYETPGCDNQAVSDNKSLTGAVKLASSSPAGNNGSDFYLVRLNEPVPAAYQPYYAGWTSSGALSPSGVCIHHPGGDVKKISTYTDPLTLDQWGQTAETHYQVVWSETENGHGVTEGGSSGSPLFDNNGLLIGQLTGGESGCSNLTGPDFYGRLYYSWTSNGVHDTVQLKPWLDPLNTGITTLNGSFNLNLANALFAADTTVIPVGSSVRFSDLSSGGPLTWHWEFEGGEPQSSEIQTPGDVVYQRTGTFNVKLVVSNEAGSDSLVRENYIRVVPVIFPNPATEQITVLLGDKTDEAQNMIIFNSLGQTVLESGDFCPGSNSCVFSLSGLKPGYYFVRITGMNFSETYKLLVIRN